MTLKLWTSAETGIVKKVFGAALKSMSPIPAHEFIAWEENGAPPNVGPGDVLLVCGTKPLMTLQAAGLAPKGRKVNSMRETVVKVGGGYALTTFDPNVVNSEPAQQQIMEWDLRLATRLMVTGSVEPVVGTYRWVNTFQPLIDSIKAEYEKTGQGVHVCVDTETETFYPWYSDRDMVTIQFTKDDGTADVLYVGRQKPPIDLDPSIDLFSQIEWLLTSPMVKLEALNGKYDLLWIKMKWGIQCTNFKFDPILAGNLLDENRSNSLNTLCKIKTDMGGYDDEFNATVDKGKLGDYVPDDKFLTYCGGDTDGGHQVARVIRNELMEDERLTRFYVKVLHPAARAFEKIEERGVCIDQQKFAELSDDLKKVIAQGQKKTLELLPNKMRIKYRDRIDAQLAEGKSPMLPSILKEYFFSPSGLNLKPKMLTGKTQEPSTSKAHLRMFGDNPDAKHMVEALTEMDQAAKTDSTFVTGFIKHVRPDGRLHPIYMLFHGGLNDDDSDDSGTTTGRLSAKEPAIQITPKKTKWAKRIRQCFPAPPGKKIIMLDYIQGELKVVACLANEPTMIKAYEEGKDLHALMGARMAHMSYDEFLLLKKLATEPWTDKPFDAPGKYLSDKFKYFRDRAKPANFGLLYGIGVDGFIAYAWATYQIKLTYEEAEKIHNIFFGLYPELLTYHKKQRSLVHAWQHVRSPLGRVRHLPHINAWDKAIKSRAERQAINAPTQATLTDMMIWAIALIDDAYPNGEIEIVAMIHDAFVAYVDEDKVDLRCKQAAEIMGGLPFHELGWKPQLPFPAEAEAGINLADLEPVAVH